MNCLSVTEIRRAEKPSRIGSRKTQGRNALNTMLLTLILLCYRPGMKYMLPPPGMPLPTSLWYTPCRRSCG